MFEGDTILFYIASMVLLGFKRIHLSYNAKS